MLLELFVLVVVVYWLLRCFVHVSLPQEITERFAMHCVHLFIRLADELPCTLMQRLGIGTFAQIRWSRRLFVGLRKLHFFAANQEMIRGCTITTEYLDRTKCRVYRCKDVQPPASHGSIVFVHGGGFCLMKVEDYDSAMAHLAKLTGLMVISLEYRKAPEYPFPTALNDLESALCLYLQGDAKQRFDVDPTNTVIMGDSAGGNLVAALVNRMKHRTDVPPFVGQVLIYPLLQMVDLLTPSHQQYYHCLAKSGALSPHRCALMCCGYANLNVNETQLQQILNNRHVSKTVQKMSQFHDMDYDHLPESFTAFSSFKTKRLNFVRDDSKLMQDEIRSKLESIVIDPDFSPMFCSDLSRAPRTMVITCGFDVLRDDGYFYYRRLREAGVQADWKNFGSALHGVLSMPMLKLTAKMIEDIAEFCLSSIS